MKRLIVAFCILALIIGLGVWEQKFIHEVFDDLSLRADSIAVYLENNDTAAAFALSAETCEWWQGKEDILELISPHNEIKDILLQISELEGNIYADQLDVALSRIIILKDLCESRKCLLSYKLKNVL